MSDIPAEKPNVIDLGQVAQIAAQDPFWAIRGKAIGAYSVLEQSLCALFTKLMRSPDDRGAVVFFKINSSTTRIAIFDKLIRKQFENTYSLFWNAYLKELRQLDLKRNEIVHWSVANNIGDGGAITVQLMPPSFWDYSPDTQTINAAQLVEFALKCDVFARLCNMFVTSTLRPEVHVLGFEPGPWLAIFQQPLVYPLPAGHPLNPQMQAP